MFSFFERLFTSRLQPAPTRDQWFADYANVERLREIIVDPVFISAVNYLLDEARITNIDVFAKTELLHLRAAHSAGYTSFIRDLESLSKAPVTRAALPQEWSHIESED